VPGGTTGSSSPAAMEDLIFAAQREIARRGPDADLERRFQLMLKSPLRAAILRFLTSRPNQPVSVETLMQAFGRLRQDVEGCIGQLVEVGVIRRLPGTPPVYTAQPSGRGPLSAVLNEFLQEAPATLEEESPSVQRFRHLIGRDEKMIVVFESIRTVAKSDIPVMVLGPTGAGKEVAARMIHELSRRRDARFQAVNCAALPDSLFESELFGFEKGAFTDAHVRKLGRLEMAHEGTLFLDEIGDLSLVAQAKLLRVLEERRFERLGGNAQIDVDFRLMSATNRPLDQLARDGRFREDLFYRCNAFVIRLPSLRERRVDIPLLAERFLEKYCTANGLAPDAKHFARDAMDRLLGYRWPGNIRELESTVTRAALSARDSVIRSGDIQFLHASEAADDSAGTPLMSLREAERRHIRRILQAVSWNKKAAADILEISRGTLYRKIVEFGLQEGSSSQPVA
jgi:DNA-binding NtrC family response regulator